MNQHEQTQAIQDLASALMDVVKLLHRDKTYHGSFHDQRQLKTIEAKLKTLSASVVTPAVDSVGIINRRIEQRRKGPKDFSPFLRQRVPEGRRRSDSHLTQYPRGSGR